MAIINGYKVVWCPNHPRATTNGMVYEHILVAEQKIGRQLKPEEVVHHINHVRSDNRPENLMVFASNKDHTAFHNGCEIFLDDEGIAHSQMKKYSCKICGNPISKDATYCRECFKKQKTKITTIGITREELKCKIRHQSFLSIGRELGICGNSVKNLCKAYGLPYKSSIIKSYSDDEWNNV